MHRDSQYWLSQPGISSEAREAAIIQRRRQSPSSIRMQRQRKMEQDRMSVLKSRIKDLVAEHGSMSRVSMVTGVNVGNLSKMLRGKYGEPTTTTLKLLGIERELVYRVVGS